MKRRARVPATRKEPRGSVWLQAYRCESCTAEVVHVEVSDGHDEPMGAPLPFLICDACGGTRYPVGPREGGPVWS